MTKFLIFSVLAGAALIASFAAAEHASGHMPGSGYAEERRWGRIAFGLLILFVVFVIFAYISG